MKGKSISEAYFSLLVNKALNVSVCKSSRAISRTISVKLYFTSKSFQPSPSFEHRLNTDLTVLYECACNTIADS